MTEVQEQENQVKNIFPLHVLKVSQNTQVMVQLKSGQTYNGILIGVDKFTNIKLTNAYLTDSKGEIFRKVGEVYIRGNVIKYFFLQNSSLHKIQGTLYKPPQKFNKLDNKSHKKKPYLTDHKK